MNAKSKYALHYINRQEHVLSAHSMADNLLKKDINSFWKEVKTLNRAKAALPCSIEGVTDVVAIADLWRQHYAELFNCIKYEPYHVGKIDEESICFHPDEVLSAIGQLAGKKASGLDNIPAEHLKLAGPMLAVLLSVCFTGMVIHGILPGSMLSVVLLPVIKDKAGKSQY